MELDEPVELVERSNGVFSPFNISKKKVTKNNSRKLYLLRKITKKNLQKIPTRKNLQKITAKIPARKNLQKSMQDFHPKRVNSKPRCDFENRICQISNSIYGVTR